MHATVSYYSKLTMSKVSVVIGEKFKLHCLPIMQQKPIFMQYPIHDDNKRKVKLSNNPFKVRLHQVCDAITVLRLYNLKIILTGKELFLVMSGSSFSHIPHI